MKKILLVLSLLLFLNADLLDINGLRTDLYSKSGANTLKKVELSLQFQGNNLEENKAKVIDSINTVIAGFFYEDIFTELGKDTFKNTLKQFLQKKYKIKVDDIYILSLSGVEKFDIEEFKRFLQSSEAKENNASEEFKKSVENLQIPEVKVPEVPKIDSLLDAEKSEDEKNNTDDIRLQDLNLFRPKLENNMTKENNTTGFSINLDENTTN